MSLENYRDRVKKLARQRAGEPIYNGSMDHAAIIVEEMFAHARDTVRILTGSLNARVYGPKQVIEQAQLFLASSNHKLQILIEDGNASNILGHPFFDRFFGPDRTEKFENVEVRVVPRHYQEVYNFHFLVMDGDSYRFESDKRECAAVAAFGDKQGAENMDRIFEKLWTICANTPLNLPQLALKEPQIA